MFSERLKAPIEAFQKNPFDWDSVATMARVAEILQDPKKISRAYWPHLSDEKFLEKFYPGCADELAALLKLPLEERCRYWQELTHGEIYWPELGG